MFTLLAFSINILLNPLICKVKYFLSKKQHQQTKFTLPGVLLEHKSGSLICEESFFAQINFRVCKVTIENLTVYIHCFTTAQLPTLIKYHYVISNISFFLRVTSVWIQYTFYVYFQGLIVS